MDDPDERDAQVGRPRHADGRWSFRDRLLHGNRGPLTQLGVRGWTALTLSEFALVALAVENLAKPEMAGVGWLALALIEAALFAWYVRRPIGK